MRVLLFRVAFVVASAGVLSCSEGDASEGGAGSSGVLVQQDGRRVLALSGASSCALLESGQVKCWGFNDKGQLGLGDTNNRGDGPGEMGDSLPAVDLGPGAEVTAVAAGQESSCVLVGGKVKCWGSVSPTNALGDGPGEMGSGLSTVDLGTSLKVTALSAGTGDTCALFESGQVKCWFYSTIAADLPFERLGGRAIAVASGFSHACALLESGQVTCWGTNVLGELGQGDGGSQGGDPSVRPTVDLGKGARVVSLTVGFAHSCALLESGQVKCWGFNSKGQLGLGDTDNRGDGPGEMGDALPAVDLGTGQKAVSIQAGGDHTCALLESGQIKCWGSNTHGELGQEKFVPRGDGPGEMGDALPVVNLGAGQIVSLVANVGRSCVVFADGRLKCWGISTVGQLGLGDTDNRGNDPGGMGDALPAVDLGGPVAR